MIHVQNDREDGIDSNEKSANSQLATPALSPILEAAPFTSTLQKVLDTSNASDGRSQTVQGRRRAATVGSDGDKAAVHEAISLPSSDSEPARVLKLSPIQIYDLTNSPGSLPLRSVDTPTDEFAASNSALVSPATNVPHKSLMGIVSPLSGEHVPHVPHELLLSVPQPAVTTTGSNRPQHAQRSLTSPLLRRREISCAPRNPRSTADGSKSSKPGLQPLKVNDEPKRDASGSVKPSPALASPMPQVIPLPPLSLPTYLQLELSSERPSALYIHRPSSIEFSYESSKVKFERLLNFLRLPHQLEQVLWFGTLACLDAWLYSFTILPLRFLKALWLLVSWWAYSLIKEMMELFRYVLAGIRRHWRRDRTAVSTSRHPRRESIPVRPSDPRPSRGMSLDADETASDTQRRGRRTSSSRVRSARRAPSGLSPSHKADLLHGLLIITSCLLLIRFDASRMYHSIRGQAAIKLYVIYNVLEVCDRLFSALGQDVLECLFSKETLERKPNGRSKVIRPIWMFLLALVYNVIHATLLFYQVVTLNVAVNSYSNALLTLLMSNQFVEIKGTVFKKFEKENLFQLTCADVVERFQLWLMLSIIGARNIVEVGGLSLSSLTAPRPLATSSSTSPNSTTSPIPSLLPAAFSLLPSLSSPVLAPFLIVLGSEMLVDWLKHAYINKFNSVKPAIYGRFLDVLAKDYYAHAFADQNLTKRLGLPTLPLACLVLRAGSQVWSMFVATTFSGTPATSSVSRDVEDDSRGGWTLGVEGMMRRAFGQYDGIGWGRIRDWSADDAMAFGTVLALCLLLWLVLLAFKLVLGMALLGFARGRYRGMKEREREGYDTNSRRVGGWGVTEVDEDKRRWIYEDDPEGLRRLREREVKDREKRQGGEGEGKGGLKLEGVGRYMMAAKRIW